MDSFLTNYIHKVNKNNYLVINLVNTIEYLPNLQFTEKNIQNLLKHYHKYPSEDKNYIEYNINNSFIEVNQNKNKYYSIKTLDYCIDTNQKIILQLQKCISSNENLITFNHFNNIEKKGQMKINRKYFEIIIDYFQEKKYFTIKLIIKKPIDKSLLVDELTKINDLLK